MNPATAVLWLLGGLVVLRWAQRSMGSRGL